MSSDLDIAKMLSTRLCHDLAGPVSAISAGIELMGGDPEMIDAEALDLLAASAGAAGKKLKFLRIAFGSPGAGAVTNASVLSAFEDYLEAVGGSARTTTIVWIDDAEYFGLTKQFGESAGQALANLVLVCFEAAPGASSLNVALDARQQLLQVSAKRQSGSRASHREDLTSVFTDAEPPQLTPHNVQAQFAKKVIEQGRGVLGVRTSDDALLFTVQLSA